MFRKKQRASASEIEFWEWFLNRSDEYFSFEKNQEPLFDALGEALSKIHPDLCFEFGPIEKGQREFVISAGGIKSSFPEVIRLCRAAPEMSQWRLLAFRPRRDPNVCLEFNGETIGAEDVWFQLTPDGRKIGVTLFLPDIGIDKETILQISYLMLDNALGEFDVETKLGFIEYETIRHETRTENLEAFVKLPRAVDEMFDQLN